MGPPTLFLCWLVAFVVAVQHCFGIVLKFAGGNDGGLLEWLLLAPVW